MSLLVVESKIRAPPAMSCCLVFVRVCTCVCFVCLCNYDVPFCLFFFRASRLVHSSDVSG